MLRSGVKPRVALAAEERSPFNSLLNLINLTSLTVTFKSLPYSYADDIAALITNPALEKFRNILTLLERLRYELFPLLYFNKIPFAAFDFVLCLEMYIDKRLTWIS